MPRIELQTIQSPLDRTEQTLEPRLEQQLRQELKQYAALKQRQDAINTLVEEKRQRLIAIRRESGLESIDLDGYKVALVNGRRHFDRKEFVRLGGDLKVYDAAMVPGEKQERVTLPGEKRGESS